MRERDKKGYPKNGWFAVDISNPYSLDPIYDPYNPEVVIAWHLLRNYKVIACFRPKE